MPRRCVRISGTTPDGQPYVGVATVFESSHRCNTCGKPASIQCDYQVIRAGKASTCDRWCCRGCATSVGPDRDYCAPHARVGKGSSVVPWIDAPDPPDPPWLPAVACVLALFVGSLYALPYLAELIGAYR